MKSELVTTLCCLLVHLLPFVGLAEELPAVNIPASLRVQNWQGDEGEGSCTIAALATLLQWQGRFETASHLAAEYGNGQSCTTLTSILQKEGIAYAVTFNGNDVAFLEWAIKTRRGCGVSTSVYRPADHMILLVHLDEQRAGIIDVRNPTVTRYVPREEFLADWFDAHSWAITPVYSPLPPVN